MPKFYIPPRVYSLLKCIYQERITIVTAPDGYGKSGTVREFVKRSRPDGYSCRFINEAETANDCFEKICKILLGKEAHIPTTAREFNSIRYRFSAAKPQKELLIVLDCPGATDMLLGNLYCTWLFLYHSPIHIVLVTNELTYFHKMLADTRYIPTINEGDLALTLSETKTFLKSRGLDGCDYEDMRIKTGGELAKLSFCCMLMKRGEEVKSYELRDLIKQAILDKLSPSRTFAALCAAAFTKVDDKTVEDLHSESALCNYFGEASICKEMLIEGTRYISSILPLVRMNRRSNHWSAKIFFKQAAEMKFNELPKDVQNAIHRCIAKEYLREKKIFRAFCQYYLSGDVQTAAFPEMFENISFEMLMRTKDFLLYYAQTCPLNCKPMLPRLLRILALLMLTPHRNKIRHRFVDIINYISTSPDYSGAERRNTLCYAYALRTYEDFYYIERMGNHIKRAYDLYSGSSIGIAPFFSWGLYNPSMFCLIHHYNLPLATEAEQFSRYHSMYTEMIHHGEHVLSLYHAEVYYYTGDLETALVRSQEVIKKCNRDLFLPTRIGAIYTSGKCALLVGNYDLFTGCESLLADTMKRFSTTELGDMAALCLAQLSGMRNGGDEDMWRVTSTPDENVMLNRYVAPFYFYARCFALLSHKEYRMLLSKIDYYLRAAEDVRSETIALSIKLSAAIAHFTLADSVTSIEIIAEVLPILGSSGVIMPAVELCMLYPQVFELALKKLPEHEKLLTNILGMSKAAHNHMIAVRTRELTELGRHESEAATLYATLDVSLAVLKPLREKYRLTDTALRYAVYAARRYSNEQIAEICSTSVNSVKSSLKRTFAKLGIHSRGQLKFIFKIRE